MSVLTARATQTLAAQARAFLGSGNVPPELEQPLTDWETRATAVLSQALSGFNDALLTRVQQAQLRVFDPDAVALMEQVGLWVGTANRGAPMPVGGFQPLRAGALQIDRLRVLDALGQVREVGGPVGRADDRPEPRVPDTPADRCVRHLPAPADHAAGAAAAALAVGRG